MSHLIVPLETPQSRRFDKKKKNKMIFRCQLKELDFSIYCNRPIMIYSFVFAFFLYDYSLW